MSERDDLLRGIREHPDDDAPRLVFADWLDEHPENGNAEWATTIRRQVEVARTPRTDLRYWPSHRLRCEPEKPADAAVRLVPRAIRKYVEVHRGFPDTVRLTARMFLRHHAALGAGPAPLACLRLSQAGQEYSALLARPELAHFRQFRLENSRFDQAAARLFADCPHLAALTTLSLANTQLSCESVTTITRSPYLANLHDLELVGDFSSMALRGLTHASTARPLQRLALHGNLPAVELAALASPGLARLRELRLVGGDSLRGLLWALADERLPELTALQVYRPITTASFFSSACFRRLTELSCTSRIPAAVLAAVPEDPGPPGLSLSVMPDSAEEFTALTRSPILGRCVSLWVRCGGASPNDLRTLAESPYSRHLRVLCLPMGLARSARLDAAALEPFVISPHWSGLFELQLPDGSVTDDGLAALMGASFAGSLRRLSLGHCRHLTATTLLRLADPTTFPNLAVLEIMGDVLTQMPPVIAALRERWPDLGKQLFFG